MRLTSRLADRGDVPLLVELIDAAIAENQKGFLDEAQIEASHAIMGLDTQLIDDGTYHVIFGDADIAGCGGWSRRATLYGGDHSSDRDAALLDPTSDAARIRAMYTHPAFTRRGVGRMILEICEQAAACEGFTRLQLMATMSGLPLYESHGFVAVERTAETVADVSVPIVRMEKPIDRRPLNGEKPSG